MKNLKPLFAAAAVVAISGAAQAAPLPALTAGPGAQSVRQFVFDDTEINAGNHEDADFQGSKTIAASSTTNVDVEPYIFVTGSFGGNWKLNGWDANKSTIPAVSILKVFHNSNFSMDGSGFGNPTNAANGHSLPMTINISSNSRHQDYTSTPTGERNADQFNYVIDSAPMSGTDGEIDYTFRQTITAPTDTSAGVYTVTPTLTFTSNAN